MKGLLGEKLGMTQILDEQGNLIPVTVIKTGPCIVVQKKTKEKDKYESLQLGFKPLKKKKVLQPMKGHFKKAGVKPCQYLREFAFKNIDQFKLGMELKVDTFTVGEKVDITGISKGKGFAGAMKRWGFSGGPRSHGSMSHRRPASGGSTDAAKTLKGKRSPGRMGARRSTVQGLKIIKVYNEKHLLLVKGGVPGANGSILEIRKSIKR